MFFTRWLCNSHFCFLSSTDHSLVGIKNRTDVGRQNKKGNIARRNNKYGCRDCDSTLFVDHVKRSVSEKPFQLRPLDVRTAARGPTLQGKDMIDHLRDSPGQVVP